MTLKEFNTLLITLKAQAAISRYVSGYLKESLLKIVLYNDQHYLIHDQNSHTAPQILIGSFKEGIPPEGCFVFKFQEGYFLPHNDLGPALFYKNNHHSISTKYIINGKTLSEPEFFAYQEKKKLKNKVDSL